MRIHPARLLSIGLLLGITVGVASAAPTAVKNTNAGRKPLRKIHSCEAKPTRDQCLEKFYLDDCGKKWGDACRDHVTTELETHYNANTSPTVTMFKPRAHEIPNGLREGKTNEYPGPKNKVALAGAFPKIGQTTVKRKAGKSTLKPVPQKAQRPDTFGTSVQTRMGTPKRTPMQLSKAKFAGGIRTLTSDNIFARTGLTRPPNSGLGFLPVNAHRMPAWDANGARVASCEEYAYEQMYDWARYTDAVAACAGDLHCQLDIAFLPSTPGIADRTLRSKDGTPTSTQINVTTGQKLPKNDFFLVGSKFVYAGGADGPLEPTPELEALEAALESGKEQYTIGGSKYASEWDFHRQLHDANRTVTQAEFEEYELRKARFRELLQKWQWAAAAEEARLKGHFVAVHEWVSPIDMVTSNPFERMEQMQKRSRSLVRSAAKMKSQGLVDGRGVLTEKGKAARAKAKAKAEKKSRATAGKSKSSVPAAKSTTPKTTPAAKSTTPAATPAAKSTTPAATPGRAPRGMNKLPGGTASVQPTALMGYVPKGNKAPSSSASPSQAGNTAVKASAKLCDPKSFTTVMEMFGKGPLSCQLGQMLREEWSRKRRGKKSCLDLDDDDCDWSPMMFEARFTKGLPYIAEQQQKEAYCVDWTNDQIDRPTLAQAKAYIDEKKAEIEAVLAKLKPYQKEPGNKKSFGKAWVDSDYFGDKALFAAGYDYDLGWDLSVVDSQGGNVCEIGAGARGGFGVDGWFIDNQFEIVDGRAQADWNRAGDKRGDLDIHLRVFSIDVFDPVKESFQGAWEEPLFTNSIQIPTGYKPSFTVMAGPVPITGAVWGEFFYGAKFGISAVSESPNCDMSQMTFGVDAAFTPELGLNAKAQVGIGISGLLSAGVRGLLNLVTVGVPVTTRFSVTNKQVDAGLEANLGFDLDVRLSLATLSGWLALYVEFLFLEEEFIIFRWAGLGPESISLLGEPLHAELPLFVMAN